MRQAGRRVFTQLSLAAAFCAGGAAPAWSQTFQRPPETDIAHAWLDLLFRGTSLPDAVTESAPNLSRVADALHQALGIYSTSILIIAGFLLFYNLAVMVLETAHYGVPLGRRSTQVWGPIRLVLAIACLVPVSGSLNAGQYVVAWMAEQGSALASHVWTLAANTMRDSFAGITMPKGPNVAGFVVGGLEMEFCRSLYHRTYKTFEDSRAVQASGNIEEIQKLPRARFAEETWQYTDRLQAAVPMCGAYRFATSHLGSDNAVLTSNIDRLTNDFANFSRAETDKLIGETQPLADNNVSVFLGEMAGPGVHDSVMALIASHGAALEARLHDLITNDPDFVHDTLAQSAAGGWITAGGFMLHLSRQQEMYGMLASHALPSVQAPVFAAGYVVHPNLADQIAADPILWAYAAEEINPLKSFQSQMAREAQQAHEWLYNRQLIDVPMILANPFDLRSQMNAADDPEAISSLFGHVLNDAANTYGVWNAPIANTNPLAVNAEQPLLALPSSTQNPITALAEFGRRQVALGNYLFGVAGPDVAPPGTLAYSLLLGAVGLGFMASGFALMFVIPLLPFFRFFMGVLTWLLSVFEAIIAVPLVALAHVNLSGEGISGGALKQAYLLWLNILIRPALTLFGFITGLLLFSFAIVFLGMIFFELGRLAAPGNREMFVTLNVALTFLYTILACAAANMAFKGITFLPEIIFKWIGGFSVPERAEPVQAGGGHQGAGLPNLTVSANLLAQQSLRDDKNMSLVTRGYANAQARAHGLKMALFPHYRDNEKYVPPTTTSKDATSIQKIDTGPATRPTDTFGPTIGTTKNMGIRSLQKPEKRKKDDPDNLTKKTDAREGAKTSSDETPDQGGTDNGSDPS